MKEKESDSYEPRQGGREKPLYPEPHRTRNSTDLHLQPRPVRQRPRKLALYVCGSGKPAFTLTDRAWPWPRGKPQPANFKIKAMQDMLRSC